MHSIEGNSFYVQMWRNSNGQCRVREGAWTWELDSHRVDLHSATHHLCDLRQVVQLL